MWANLYTAIRDILSVMCPLKNYRQRAIITPWITADIYRTMRYRDRLIALYKATSNSHYLTLAKQQRNVVNSMVESAKKLYISSILINTASCPKKFWRQINRLIKGDKNVNVSVSFTNPVTNVIVPKGSEPDFLNDFFCNISSRLGFDNADTVVYNNDYLDMYNDIDDVFNLLSDLPTVDEIVLHSQDIDITKNSCIDGISTNICKDLLTLAPNYFMHIYISSIRTGIFPEDWAKGIITVLPKVGDLSNPSNWRPITQTPIFAKILEKVIHKRLINYLDENSILSKYQYGFRKGKSTQEAIFDLVKYVYSGLNHKKVVSAICLDVAKAFDCINHDILLLKMKKIGFTDLSVNWFRSYLTRTQIVKFDNIKSSKLNVKTGIGQGTILGPLLFIFYINDITSVLQNLKLNMYADDCILYCSGNDWKRMLQKIQPELDRVHAWCDVNRLKINTDKSKSLICGSRSKLGRIDYTKHATLNNHSLDNVSRYKYLGVTLDSEMSLINLLADVKKSVLNKLFTLRKLRYYITEKSAISIYKQMILPVFDYPGFLLISCNKSDPQALQVIQNDALRCCYNVRRRDKLSVSSMHKKSKLLSLEQRRTFQLLSLMFLHKNCRSNLKSPIRNTREADRPQFTVERYQNMRYKKSPFYKGVELWKLLPLEIVNSDSLFQFKKNLKSRYKTYLDVLNM